MKTTHIIKRKVGLENIYFLNFRMMEKAAKQRQQQSMNHVLEMLPESATNAVLCLSTQSFL